MTGAAELDRRLLESFPLPELPDGDKNERGRLLIIAGQRSLPGAALLCAQAAMRAGAGSLKIATVQSVAANVGIAVPESRTIGLAEAEDGGFARSAVAKIGEHAEDVDAVIAGPGMLESPVCEAMAEALLKAGTPVALDAGILRSLPPVDDAAAKAKTPPILLPHAGEMATLLGCEKEEVEADPVGQRLRALTPAA